ncbi:hypothetical protein LguiA_021301 [Lonicera macranthoides]
MAAKVALLNSLMMAAKDIICSWNIFHTINRRVVLDAKNKQCFCLFLAPLEPALTPFSASPFNCTSRNLYEKSEECLVCSTAATLHFLLILVCSVTAMLYGSLTSENSEKLCGSPVSETQKVVEDLRSQIYETVVYSIKQENLSSKILKKHDLSLKYLGGINFPSCLKMFSKSRSMSASSSSSKTITPTESFRSTEFFRDTENEKRALQVQLESLERSEAAKRQAAAYSTPVPPTKHPTSDFPDYSVFYPPQTPPSSTYNLSDYSLSEKPHSKSINLWDEPPKRRLPPWSTSPPKLKPKFVPPKSNYPYQAKHPSQADLSKPYRAVTPPPIARQARGIVLNEPNPSPLQTIPPSSQPQQITSHTTPKTTPSAYTPPTESGDVIQGASTKPLDMFTMEAFENHSVNQIGYFLKALTLSDREPVKTESDDLFQAFDQLYSAQPTAEPTQEPMVEDPPEPVNVPLNQPPPQTNHAHDNHPLRVPHLDGSNATIEAWFTENLSKSIKEPYNLNYVTFLKNICALNKVDYDSILDYVKFDHDPWQKAPWEVCGPLFERLYSYAICHRWDYGELSSDSEAFVGMDTDEDEDDDPNAGNFGEELAELADTSNDEDGSPYSPDTPIYGHDHYDLDFDGNETNETD